MLVQPGEGRLGEAVHAGCGDHAIEGLKEGPDDDAELMAAADLRTKLAKAMVTHPVAVGSRTVEQICWFFSSYSWVTGTGVTRGTLWEGCVNPVPAGAARNGCLDTRQLFQSRSRSQLAQCARKCPGAGCDTRVLPWCSQPPGTTAGDQ